MARRYALVVGISEYQKPLHPLSKTTNDAEAVTVALKQFGDFQEVTTLKGSVSSTKLIQALRTLLLEQATQNDVLIYFTGHGIPVIDPVVGKPKAYLATSDTVVTLEGKQVIEQRRAVPLDSLNDLIQESQLSSLVMLFDSCHSGDFLERSLVEKTFAAFLNHKDYYLIAACRGFEQAYARKSEQHSIFTGALLVGLSPANANEDGQVTGDRLFEFIARELKGSGQEPIRRGNGGLITLVRYQPEPKVIAAIVDEAGELVCPYQGLQAFTAAQREFFFGRQRVVEEIRRRLEEKPFVPIIGASGSGKSSVVRAGLIPWLEETGWTVLTPIKPGFEPLAALKTVFEPFFQRSNRDIQQLRRLIQHELHPLPALVSRLSSADSEQEQAARFLLVVDQFEELFTLCADERDRQRFIDLITQVVELADARLAVIITMRADFLEPCLRYPALRQLIESQTKYLSSPTGVDLRDAIVEPARRQGYDIEESLLFQIQEDVGKEPGFLPLLEFALTQLWENRDTERKLLTLEQYERLGGLAGALNLHAERVYQYRDFERSCPVEQRSEQEQTWIQQIFLRLVRTGEEEKDTRQRQTKTELLEIAGNDSTHQDALRELIEDEGGLVQGRLLVTGQELPNKASWVDLAHEALLDGWKRFAEWRKGDRAVRRLVDRMEDARREWEHQNRHLDFLLPKGLLTQIKLQETSVAPYFTFRLREFYALSKDHEQRQSDALEWTKTEAALIARAREAKNLLTTRPVEGLLQILKLVEASLRERGEPISAIQDGLRSAMELCREQNCLYGHQGSVTCVAYHPNGKIIASGGDDGTIRLWNQTGELIQEFFNGRHHSSVTALEFSPDGQFLASAGDRLFRFYDLNGGQIGEIFQGHWDEINSLSFSPNGQSIVSGSRDGTLRLWDLAGNLIGQPFRGHRGAVFSVHFSPDGEAIASSSADGTIRLWDIQGKPIEQPFEGHQGAVRAVRFSPDGQVLVSGSDDKTICLWDLKGNPIGQPFRGHEGCVCSVMISPDSRRVVSSSVDKTIRLWDLSGNQIGQPLLGHEADVTSVVFSPDSTKLSSSSSDTTIRLWDLEDLENSSIGHPFQGHASAVFSVAFSPDGSRIVSGSDDKTIRLWDLDGNSIGQPFQGHAGAVFSVAFSPDGSRIVSGSEDKTIRLWDLDGTPIGQPFRGHKDVVNSVAFSPDGSCIVSGSDDKTIRLWDLDGNPIGQPFRGHKAAVFSVTFTPDGRHIASGSEDKTIRLWDLDGTPIGQPFQGHAGAVRFVSFSLDGSRIVSGSFDSTIRSWRGGAWQDWLAICCNRIRHRPYFKNPQAQEARTACEVYQKYVSSQESNME